MLVGKGLDAVRSYMKAQVRTPPAGEGKPEGPGTRPFVTISRQAGACAVAIADTLAEALTVMKIGASGPAWTVFERDLLKVVVQEHHLPEGYMRDVEETRVPELQAIGEEMFGMLSPRTLAAKTSRTILHLAHLGNVIIVGRGGNLVTRLLPGGLRVRLIGTSRARMHRLMDERKLSRRQAEKQMARLDDARQAYVRKFFQRDVEDPLLYDLVVNTDGLRREAVAETLAYALRVRRIALELG
jgi:hypothetical protein